MLEFEKQSIDARKKMVTSMGYPMVGLGVNYSSDKQKRDVRIKYEWQGHDNANGLCHTAGLPEEIQCNEKRG